MRHWNWRRFVPWFWNWRRFVPWLRSDPPGPADPDLEAVANEQRKIAETLMRYGVATEVITRQSLQLSNERLYHARQNTRNGNNS